MANCEHQDGLCRYCGTAIKPSQKRNCTGFRLGDFVSRCLKSIGITPERVERVTGKPCGCKKRQEAMNRWL